LRRAVAELSAASIEDASLEAEVLLRHALGLDRAQLYARLSEELPPGGRTAFEALVARRLRREPTAYITGQREFYGLMLDVTPAAPIPRPETELLVDEALAQARRLRHAYRGPHMVDVGTGCGAIALAVAMHLPVARLTAIDASQDALKLARRNAERLGLSGRVRFALGDLLSPLAGYARRDAADIVVANLPYVPSCEWEGLAPEIRRYEPRAALDGGPDGLRLIERLLGQAPTHVRSPGALILEIGHDQAEAVAGLALQAFPTAAIAVKKDLASLDRAVVIET
jgi:release factor glutamine methyltransferase